MANGWGLYNLDGSLTFDVDTCIDLKFSNKAKVSNFPVETGGFASYNKVNEPNAIKVRLAVGGTARMAAFQAALMTEVVLLKLKVSPFGLFHSPSIGLPVFLSNKSTLAAPLPSEPPQRKSQLRRARITASKSLPLGVAKYSCLKGLALYTLRSTILSSSSRFNRVAKR